MAGHNHRPTRHPLRGRFFQCHDELPTGLSAISTGGEVHLADLAPKRYCLGMCCCRIVFTEAAAVPNDAVYPDGRVCISILHPAGDDPNGYELASERWSPVHTVETILLSIISMLSSPNDESPANIDAAKVRSPPTGCPFVEMRGTELLGALGVRSGEMTETHSRRRSHGLCVSLRSVCRRNVLL
eukprot:scaffold790_cov387-Prasinococcus_capsulatus_cf.AAC.14